MNSNGSVESVLKGFGEIKSVKLKPIYTIVSARINMKIEINKR
jgi:hypothetical protein